MRTLQLIVTLITFLLSFAVTGCLDTGGSGTESGTTEVTDPNTVPQSPTADPNRTICDPFATNSPQAQNQGLAGNLLYLTDDQPRYNNVEDFIDNGHIASATIYLDRLYIPTRPFDRGFTTQSGTTLTNVDGTTLYEYFGLRMESQLQLAANESPGYYQLAVLADDGAIWKISDGNGGYNIIVNDDGTHSTRMGCATQPIYLDRTTKIPMVMEYYQGPRYHIALVAMWRPWPGDASDTTVANDPYCGQQGNNLFFDPTQDPPAPQEPFYELLANNWKVLENANYYFPQQAQNPCVPAEAPLAITNFSVTSVTRSSATLTWTTNINATTQGEAMNVTTSALIDTAVDSTMVQTHTVTITGLAANTLYSVKGLSATAGGQNAASDARAFRTPR